MSQDTRSFGPGQFLGPLIIGLLLSILAALPLRFNEAAENLFVDLRFNLRGERDLSNDIVLVFIGPEDINALGGWPITRDYYGYLTHALNLLGAKTVGIYLLLDTPDSRYPEHDQMLADFFEATSNVCLPRAFYEVQEGRSEDQLRANVPERALIGEGAIYPITEFRQRVAGLGFSNLTDETGQHREPLFLIFEQAHVLSFGAQLARIYLGRENEAQITPDAVLFRDANGGIIEVPVDQSGRLLLNHFGGIDRVESLGLLDLLQTFESSPEVLDLAGKIVIVDVTAPGEPTLVRTPFTSALPASLVHATVAENLIRGNYLREATGVWHSLLILLAVAAGYGVTQSRRLLSTLVAAVFGLIIYGSLALVLFSTKNLVLPLFYPNLAFMSTVALLLIQRNRHRTGQEAALKSLLQRQIEAKEAQIADARQKLDELAARLEDESSASEQLERLANERKRTIHQFESQLADLRKYAAPEQTHADFEFTAIVHAPDSPMVDVLSLVSKVAPDDIPVLLVGETGTGKEMIAHAIHDCSRRKNAPFIAVNCGALPETLLESELFGHERGSFTGAHSRRKGRFELADRGTIFLDEITETAPAFQARLLRVVQDGTFERLGGEQSITADVRIIAATNSRIQDLVQQGQFREDLYYRLNGFPITLPSLKERSEDVPPLAAHFLQKHSYESIQGFSDQAVRRLQAYPWPGNVRELENCIRRAAIIAQSDGRELIQEQDLPQEVQKSGRSVALEGDYQPLDRQVLDSLRRLQFSHSAIGKTAKALGNRDRGTITEYFRGICFMEIVRSAFDLEAAARAVVGCAEEQAIAKVRDKMQEYVQNLYPLPESQNSVHPKSNSSSHFRGLPKKYHPYLEQVIEHLRQKGA